MKTSRNRKTEKGISDGASTGLAARRGRFLVILRRRARWDLLILRLGHATFFLVLLPGRACESLLWPQHRGFIPRQSTAGPACLRECGFRAALQRCSSPFSQGDTSFLGVGFKSVDTHRPSFQLTSCLLTVEKKPRLAPTSSLWHPAQV